MSDVLIRRTIRFGEQWFDVHEVANCATMQEVREVHQGSKLPDDNHQRKPPYAGCIFVTSGRLSRMSPRRYTIRVICADRSIRRYGPYQWFITLEQAHKQAKWLSQNIIKDLPF